MPTWPRYLEGIPQSVLDQFEKDWQNAPDRRVKGRGDALFGYILALRLMWRHGRKRRPPRNPTEVSECLTPIAHTPPRPIANGLAHAKPPPCLVSTEREFSATSRQAD